MNIILALGNRNNLKAKNIFVQLNFNFLGFDLPLDQNQSMKHFNTDINNLANVSFAAFATLLFCVNKRNFFRLDSRNFDPYHKQIL